MVDSETSGFQELPLAVLLDRARQAQVHSRLEEGRMLADAVWERAEADGYINEQADAGKLRSYFRLRQGDLSGMLTVAEQAMRLMRPLGASPSMCELLRWMSLAACELGDYEQGLACAHEAMRAAGELGDVRLQAVALNGLGACFERMGDPWQAERLMTEAAGRLRGDATPYERVVTLTNLCSVALGAYHLQRDGAAPEQASRTLERALSLAREARPHSLTLGDPYAIALTATHFSDVLLLMGRTDEAEPLLMEALGQAQQAGFRLLDWRLRAMQAELHLARGEAATAWDHLQALIRETGGSAHGDGEVKAGASDLAATVAAVPSVPSAPTALLSRASPSSPPAGSAPPAGMAAVAGPPSLAVTSTGPAASLPPSSPHPARRKADLAWDAPIRNDVTPGRRADASAALPLPTLDAFDPVPLFLRIRLHQACYRAARALDLLEPALFHLEQARMLERRRAVSQLMAQSQYVVSRLEAELMPGSGSCAPRDAISFQDPLTGLGNRRCLEARLPALLRAAEQEQRPLTLALIDADDLRSINERYGHDTGDRVLQSLAQLLRENTRGSDVLLRWSGEEFLVVFPDTVPDRGFEVCERIRAGVSIHPWGELAPGLDVTLSIGLASAAPYVTDLLIARAQAAVERAKHLGRNRVALA